MTNPIVKSFWDEATGSWQYVFHDPDTMQGAIVDPVLDFDPLSGRTSTANAERLLDHVRKAGIELVWILDTHPHADHFSAAAWLKQQTGAPMAIGVKVTGVQKLWQGIYNLPADFPTDGSQWDRLFADGDRFMVGHVPVTVMFSPGHTLASITYVAGDAAFVHDTLMMPDSGSSRADFPGGSSDALYDSIAAILSLPADTRIFVGHDYAPGRDRGAASRREHPLEGRALTIRLPRGARCKGCDLATAQADAGGLAGQYPGRAATRAGGQRALLPQDSVEPFRKPLTRAARPS
jgi:glyoxylase-like metal-dependent hydrolase (beta-lactamase superfamily II)